MRLLSSIIARIALGPLLLVLVSGLSLLIYDVHNETSLRQVIARHDQSARLKDVIQQAIGDMAAAQQSASEYLLPSDAGLADTMRAEVTQFLKAMASNDDDERRQYERISGNGMQAVIRPRGASEMRVAIVDISRGGVSLHCDWRAGPGKDVPMELPGAGGPVTARVVRSEGGKLALAFRQDEAVLRRVDQAIALIATGTTAAA